ncbi:MAG TPA: acyl-CoA thioesterase [Candidatus Solibacter sp.]|nr:acyl-CoA thioesterase [Candidatus Solibacter sp.]
MGVLINKRMIMMEWGDCDPAGIVYFPRYLQYGDSCTHALFERVGLPKPRMQEKYGIVGIPIVDAHARFLIPSSYSETLSVESSITEWGRSSFSVVHRFLRGKELAVEITEKRVWSARAADGSGRLESKEVPAEVKEKFGDGSALPVKK